MKITSTEFDLNLARQALSQLQPKKSDAQEAIHALYTDIQTSIARGVTRKAIIEQLATMGLDLHPAKFKRLMADAAEHYKPSSNPSSGSSVGGKK